jgi:hypothetical protein
VSLPDEHDLLREVYSVIPWLSVISPLEVAERVYERYSYPENRRARGEGIHVAEQLALLEAQGRVERIGDGWKRKAKA